MKARFTILALAAVSQLSYAQPAPPESAPVPPTLSKSTLSPAEQAALPQGLQPVGNAPGATAQAIGEGRCGRIGTGLFHGGRGSRA